MATCEVCARKFIGRTAKSRYCQKACSKEARLAAKRAVNAARTRGGEHVCTIEGCGRPFLTRAALSGHQAHHVKVALSLARKPVVVVVVVCDECGQPCGTPAQLAAHRRDYHRPKPIPRGVPLPGGMSFPCAHCGRVYDDENRLTHHRRVIHDEPFAGAHVVPMMTGRIDRIA